MEKPIEGIAPEAMSLMEAYDWPGNVRELENTMERSVALETGTVISANVLPEKIRHWASREMLADSRSGNGYAQIPEAGIDAVMHGGKVERWKNGKVEKWKTVICGNEAREQVFRF